MNIRELSICMECPTRWSSAFVMIDRLLHSRVAIVAALAKLQAAGDKKTPADLSAEQWGMLASMLPVLKQINIVSEYLQNQEVATIGVILPVVQGLLRNLDTTEKWELRQQHEQNPALMTVIEHFKIIAGDHLLKRFHENKIQWERELLLSVLLNPRAKDFYFIEDPIQRTELLCKACALVREELGIDGEEELICGGQISLPPTASKEQEIAMDIMNLIQPPHSKQFMGIGSELDSYVIQARVPIGGPGGLNCPLLWWRDHETMFKNLAKLARKYLVMMTSSASVERAFSQAGWIVDKRRCSLADSTVEDRLLLVANKKHLLSCLPSRE